MLFSSIAYYISAARCKLWNRFGVIRFPSSFGYYGAVCYKYNWRWIFHASLIIEIGRVCITRALDGVWAWWCACRRRLSVNADDLASQPSRRRRYFYIHKREGASWRMNGRYLVMAHGRHFSFFSTGLVGWMSKRVSRSSLIREPRLTVCCWSAQHTRLLHCLKREAKKRKPWPSKVMEK